MPNPPYSAALIILREHADGFTIDAWTYEEIPEGTHIPPKGPITHLLVGAKPGDAPVTTRVMTQNAATRSQAASKFAAFLNQKFPDTPA